jgi:nicotinamidase/pyrazinamidase
MAKALLIVDFQNDFTPGGALPVPEGDRIADPVNRLAERFDLVLATRDWHPPDHSSFEEHGGPWPVHCVGESDGAQFHSAFADEHVDVVVDKGQDPHTEGYSGFEGTGLEEMLRERGVDEVVVGGLATDYCVKNTVLDALRHGFDVTVVEDAIRGVDVNEGDSERALDKMREAGARITTSDEVLAGVEAG